MSANEELIARLRGVVEDALEDSLQVENEFCVTDAEHEAAKSDRARALSVRDDVIAALEQVTAERDELAAVVREALDVARSGSVPLGVQEARHFDRLLAETRRVLQGSPSVALDRVKAEALREAADERDQLAGDSDVISRWLRDRADRIEKGESNE
ncbi:hypothetical protein ACSAGD_10620 [Paramicrobacterium sp. CJ85]|uniref:hypothetical protein n=1 Tax=Paramicrobacterium sp. CJ85 TaxID=3445355 RepID=UPI003F62660C